MRVENLAGRQVVSTGTKWEPVIGYSRAVRSGGLIAVTGTIGINPNGTIPSGAAQQARRSLEIVISAIEAPGGRKEEIIRTRIFVTDISSWKEVGAVHAELLGDVRPATTMVEVSRLADPAAWSANTSPSSKKTLAVNRFELKPNHNRRTFRTGRSTPHGRARTGHPG